LAAASCSDNSQTACQEPTPDQPYDTGIHGRTRSALHHRVIDRFRRGPGEGVGAERDKTEIGAGCGDGGRDGSGAVRFEAAAIRLELSPIFEPA
jgi:hypothetical protein